MLHLQQPTAVRGCPECAWGKVAGCWRCGSRVTLNPEPLVAELVPMPVNYRGFVARLSPVTQEEMEEALYLRGLAEQQRREGARA